VAAARGELPNFNLLAALGLEEFRNEIDAMNAEKNVAGAEQSKFEQSNKKRRFAEMEKHDLDDILTNSQAKRTKKATQWAVSVFTGQLKQYKTILIHNYKKLASFAQGKAKEESTDIIKTKTCHCFSLCQICHLNGLHAHTLRLFVLLKNA